MSADLVEFKKAAKAAKTAKLGEKAKHWARAYKYCNGLNMPEMLEGLESLGPALLTDFDAQAPLNRKHIGDGMNRVQWAIQLVSDREIPSRRPPSVKNDQFDQAKAWLKKNPGRGIQQKRLKISLFWTKKAANADISAPLIQKAQEMFRENGNKFILDVMPHRWILNNDKEQFDAECGSEEFRELYRLVKKSKNHRKDRLPVIFYKSLQTQGPYGQVNEPLAHGCSSYIDKGHAFVLINVRKQAKDKNTLLHEIGHAAGLGHSGDDDNFMSLGKKRTEISKDQKKKLEKCFFCTK